MNILTTSEDAVEMYLNKLPDTVFGIEKWLLRILIFWLVVIVSNRKCLHAVNLYRKNGFIDKEKFPFDRADISFEQIGEIKTEPDELRERKQDAQGSGFTMITSKWSWRLD